MEFLKDLYLKPCQVTYTCKNGLPNGAIFEPLTIKDPVVVLSPWKFKWWKWGSSSAIHRRTGEEIIVRDKQEIVQG